MRSYVTRHSTAHPEETARHNMDRHQKEVRNRPKIHLIEVRIWAVSLLNYYAPCSNRKELIRLYPKTVLSLHVPEYLTHNKGSPNFRD